MWLAYGDRKDLGGFCLEKPTFTLHHGIVDLASMVQGPVFLYGLPCTTGPSPNPYHWMAYIEKYSDNLDHCPSWLSCQPNMLEPSWLDFSDQNNQLFLYLAYSETLASDHREKGVHSTAKGGRDFPPVQSWNPLWDRGRLSPSVEILSLQLELVDKDIHTALGIKKRYGRVTVTFADSCLQSCPLSDHILYVVPASCPQVLCSKPSMIMENTHNHTTSSNPITLYNYRERLLMITSIVFKLVSQKIPVLTLPSPEYSPLSQNLSSPIIAGRCQNSYSKSPDIEWMNLEATFEVYLALMNLKDSLEMGEKYAPSEVFSQMWIWQSVTC